MMDTYGKECILDLKDCDETLLKRPEITYVNNYAEAAGLVLALKHGIVPQSVSANLSKTVIY